MVTAGACWHRRHADRLFRPLTLLALVLLLANGFMLYSQSAHDTYAILAHLTVVSGYLLFLLILMQHATTDMLERLEAESRLSALNLTLEEPVNVKVVVA
jgi:hypothetical protein